MNKFQESAEIIQKNEKSIDELDDQINELRDRQTEIREFMDDLTLMDAKKAIKEGDDAEQDFYDAYGFFADKYLKN